MIDKDLIVDHIDNLSFPMIVGKDSITDKDHSFDPRIREAWFESHPLRLMYQKMKDPLPIIQLNKSCWNDGVSSVRSRRWNPVEVWTFTFAGQPHKVLLSLFL